MGPTMAAPVAVELPLLLLFLAKFFFPKITHLKPVDFNVASGTRT